MRTVRDIDNTREQVSERHNHLLKLDSWTEHWDEIAILENLSSSLQKLRTELALCSQEGMSLRVHEEVNEFIREHTIGFSLKELVWFWSGFQFGFTEMKYYRLEWFDRYEKYGIEGLLSHMDYSSRASWKRIYEIWVATNYPTQEQEQYNEKRRKATNS